MATVAQIAADLLLNDAKFRDGIERSATALGRFAQDAQKDIKNVSKQFDHMAESVTGVRNLLGTALTVYGIAAMTKDALEAADAVEKLSQKLGLTTDQIQKYEYAAKQNNVTNDELQAGFNNLNKLIAEGKVPYKDLNTAINDIANRMANAKTGAERAGIAFDTLGKTGVNLIPMFKDGAEGLKAYGDEAERIGAVLPRDTIERAAQFKTEMDTLGTVISKNFQSGLLKEFTDDSGKLRDIYSDPAFVDGVKTLGEAFGVAAKGAIALVEAYQKASTMIATLGLAAGTDLGLVDKDVYTAALQEAQDRMNGKNTPAAVAAKHVPGNGPSGSPRLDKEVPKASELDKYTSSLQRETAAIGLSQEALFEQKAVIQAENAARTDYENHLRSSAKLTAEEEANVRQLSDTFFEFKQKQQEAEKINSEFRSSFIDTVQSIESGSKTIGSAIKDLVLKMAQLLEQELILQPLANSIFGAPGSGGVGGIGGLITGASGAAGAFGSQGSLARLFETGSTSFVGPLPSFDVGTPYVPNDMTANIHKGEAVLTPQQADSWRNGQTGGDHYYIDNTGASSSKVNQLMALMMSLAGPGRVEERVRQAQRRGKI